MLIRSDLSLPQQLVQAAHAAHEAGRHLAERSPVLSSLIACALPSERALFEAYQRLTFRGIRCALFREPDLGHQATALATEPLDRDRSAVLSRYPLWKGA